MCVKFIFGIDYGTTTTLVSKRSIDTDSDYPIGNDKNKKNQETDLIWMEKNERVLWTVLRLANPIEHVSVQECYDDNLVQDKGISCLNELDLAQTYENFKPDFVTDCDNPKSKLTRIWLYIIFKKIKKHVNQDDLSEHQYAIGIPAIWDKEKRDALKQIAAESAEKANGKHGKQFDIVLCPEPIAAVLNSKTSAQKNKGKCSLFFDFGGGTLDLCLVKVNDNGVNEIIDATCNPKLGGRDFDTAFIQKMSEEIDKNLNEDDRLRAKNEITQQAFNVKDELKSDNSVYEFSIRSKVHTLTGYDYKRINEDNIQEITRTMNDFFEKHKVYKDQVKDVTLIGGATKMYFVVDIIKDFFGQETKFNSVFQISEPQEAVVDGLPCFLVDVKKFLKERQPVIEQMYNTDKVELWKRLESIQRNVPSTFNKHFKQIEADLSYVIRNKLATQESRKTSLDKLKMELLKTANEQYFSQCKKAISDFNAKYWELLQDAKLFAKQKICMVSMVPSSSVSTIDIEIKHPEKLINTDNIIYKMGAVLFPTYFNTLKQKKMIEYNYRRFFSSQKPQEKGKGWIKKGGFFYQIKKQIKAQILDWNEFWGLYEKKFSLWEDE